MSCMGPVPLFMEFLSVQYTPLPDRAYSKSLKLCTESMLRESTLYCMHQSKASQYVYPAIDKNMFCPPSPSQYLYRRNCPCASERKKIYILYIFFLKNTSNFNVIFTTFPNSFSALNHCVPVYCIKLCWIMDIIGTRTLLRDFF